MRTASEILQIENSLHKIENDLYEIKRLNNMLRNEFISKAEYKARVHEILVELKEYIRELCW